MTPLELEAVDHLAVALAGISMADAGYPDAVSVFKRNLDQADPTFSIGIVFNSWTPMESPHIGQNEPARGRYRYGIQTYVKHSEREPGERASAIFTKKVRLTLYRDPGLRLSLRTLREGDEPPIERALQYGVEQTEYADTPFTGGFAYLSQTEFYLETEVV